MPRKKKVSQGKTILVVVADESGSMHYQRNAVRDGFNEYIEEVRSNTKDVLVSLVKFNTRSTVVFENTPIDDVPRLDNNNYVPNGGTALYDGVANGVNLGSATLTEGDKAILVIFTDGQENSSIENTQEQVFKLLTQKQKDGNWTVVFLGSDQDSWASSAASLGVAAGNSMYYASTGTRGMITNTARATSAHAGSAAPSTVSFFSDAGLTADDFDKDDDLPAGSGG